MKKILFVIILASLALFVFSSCGECAHEWGMPTCEKPSTCKLCNATSGEALPHIYAPATCSLPKTCKDCGATSGEPLEHTLTVATCTRASICTVCGATVGEPSAHTFTEATCTEPAKCTFCFFKTEELADHVFAPATCQSPKTCINCNLTEGERVDHLWEGEGCLTKLQCAYCKKYGETIQHKWQEATCTTPRQCEKCLVTAGKELGHTWREGTCKEPAVCSVCNYQTADVLLHEWKFTSCTTPNKCVWCSAEDETIPGHEYNPATCFLPATCYICGHTEGTALGHYWLDATCTAPETCLRCLETQGEPIDHVFTYSHTVEPLCNEGKDVYICVCGLESSTFIAPVKDCHICDLNGVCSQCGFAYDVSKMELEAIDITNRYVDRQGVFRSEETVTKIYKPVSSDDLGIPLVELNGSIASLTGKGSEPIRIPFVYNDGDKVIECIAELKVQGASSAGYPKKNYSVKLYEEDGTKNKIKLVESWGKQFKYCLKANWVDYSQARNVVSGQIYGDVIRSRDITDELTNLANGGAIDGFPVVVYNNGVFHGLYTLNIPKDKWMFDMDDSDEMNQAIVMAIDWSQEVAMRKEIVYDKYSNWKGTHNWEIEFASNEDSLVDNYTSWVAHSLNQLVRFTMRNDGEDFKNGIHEYADVDKCIDSLLYTFFICADDNISKNILWATYDGTHWFSSVYDMDGTWGMRWNGNIEFGNAEAHPIDVLGTANPNWQYNLLWEKIYKNFYDEIVARYWELRETVYTMEHITERFEAFFNQIPDAVREAEKSKWTGVPTQNLDHLAQILEYARLRIEKMDKILVPKN